MLCNLMDKIRILAGRQLPYAKMQEVKERKELLCREYNYRRLIIKKLELLKSGEYLGTTHFYNYIKSPDISGFSRYQKVGYYLNKSVSSIYNSRGELLTRHISYGMEFFNLGNIFLRFDPPGSLFATREEAY